MDNQITPDIVQAWQQQVSYAAKWPWQGPYQIAMDEGLETEAYQDSLGNWTMGIGHLGAYPGEVWTVQQCWQTFFRDLRDIGYDPLVAELPWVVKDGAVRMWVFVNMTYNMGIGGFMAFHETIADAHQGNDWEGVAQGMEASLWYSQVGQRGVQLAKQMRTNEWILD